ncbi:MAG TPA: PilN domain-containing protein [Thiobacillaceae bacterium]|nr:PilN domain-containing protein [Thiobacillaceae bacterium]HNU63726.1 PilN domain-containing protein [Thiobacillaceae bacterium]
MTPIRINLLPHRQMRRARIQRMFTLLAGLSAAVGVAIVAAGQYWIIDAQERQERRNAFLREEIAKLDKQISEIAQLKQKTSDLLARKDVVESLQVNRAESVRLFDELARRVPEGLYIRNLKQAGDNFTIVGYAQSSARVSTFMRALAASRLFQEPTLVEVKAAQVGNQRLNEFTLNVQIERGGKPGDVAPDQAGGDA